MKSPSYMPFLKTAVVIIIWVGVIASACSDPEKIKHDQYFVGGSQLYASHCSNCHQKDGQGLVNLYPPLAGAGYLNNKENLACIIRYGLRGQIKVKGKTYHQPMPPNPTIRNIEIAQIITFITNEWGERKEITTIQEVEKALQKCLKE